MLLTGKCADRFKEWVENSNHTPWVVFFYSLPPLVQYAYCAEWFRGEQIYIDVLTDATTYPKFAYSVKCFIGNPNNLSEKEWGWELYSSELLERSYTEALKAAIEKGNDLYNTKNQ